MHYVYIAIIVVTIVMNSAMALADFAGAKFVVRAATEARAPVAWLPLLGACQAAGALGLAVGVLWFSPLAIAATIGLILYFICAVLFHVRARALHNIHAAIVFLLFAAVSLAAVLANHSA